MSAEAPHIGGRAVTPGYQPGPSRPLSRTSPRQGGSSPARPEGRSRAPGAPAAADPAWGSPRPPSAALASVRGLREPSRTLACPPDSSSGSGTSDVPAPPAPLDLTPSRLLSRAVENRRRQLLAKARDRWEIRASELRAECARYRALVDTQERTYANHEVVPLTSWAVEVAELRRLSRLLAGAVRKLRCAEARVRSLTSDIEPRVLSCGNRDRWVACACGDGAPRPVAHECRQIAVCPTCRRSKSRRLRKRLLRSLGHHLGAHASGDGKRRRPRMRLLTFTTPHTGSLDADRSSIVTAWEQLRKQLHRWFKRALPFVLVWETTPGTDGKGHEHCHVIMIGGPPRWNYAAIARVWRSALGRATGRAPAEVMAPDIQIVRTENGAAHYVTKYVTKGVDFNDQRWSDELIAQYMAAHYNKRSVTVSLGFWQQDTKECGVCGALCRAARAPLDMTPGRFILDLFGNAAHRRMESERGPPGG